MKLSKISYNPNFEARKKHNNLKAGTLALVLFAVPVSAQQLQQDSFEKRQIVRVPKSFVYGTDKKKDKSYREIFSEINEQGFKDSVLTKYEVLKAEEEYWKNVHKQPLSPARRNYTKDLFDRLIQNSDSKSIDYKAYLEIMKAYEESKDF